MCLSRDGWAEVGKRGQSGDNCNSINNKKEKKQQKGNCYMSMYKIIKTKLENKKNRQEITHYEMSRQIENKLNRTF